MTETKKTLANRIAEIMGGIGNVEKKGKINSQGSGPSYNFATDPDVLRTVIPKLSAEGIVLVPEQVEVLSVEPNMRGTQLIASIRTHWLITDGNEELRLQSLGMGQDSGDKALPKAQTNARKYALFMLLHIVTGDDPDQWSSDADSHRAPIQREKTAGEIKEDIALALGERGKGRDYLEQVGESIGAGKPATREQLKEMLRLIREGWQPPIEQPAGGHSPAEPQESVSESQASGGQEASSSGDAPAPPAELTVDDIMEAAGPGAELLPPKPGTDAYKALPSGTERSKAKAYWEKVAA